MEAFFGVAETSVDVLEASVEVVEAYAETSMEYPVEVRSVSMEAVAILTWTSPA